jgi:hypothetical protein
VEINKQQINNLLTGIELEEKEQIKRYRLDEHHSLKSLKSEGLAIHPIRISRKTFGYADYPEFNFRIPFPAETGNFRDGMAIECFCQGEESIKGILLNLDGKQGEFRLFAPDFPEWIEDEGVGIKLSPDTRTSEMMKKAINAIESQAELVALFNTIHSTTTVLTNHDLNSETQISKYVNAKLNESQKNAVNGILNNDKMLLVHGPPGTGKTTTLIESILQLSLRGEKILVSAPSNTAIDNLAIGLLNTSVNFIRVGNNTKVNQQIFPFTPEGKLKNGKQEKEIKKLKIRSEELRKMANQYKRRCW